MKNSLPQQHQLGLLFLLVIQLAGFSTSQAQVITRRFPAGNKAPATVIGLQAQTPTLTLPAIDLVQLMAEDQLRIKGNQPYRFGANLPVDIQLINAGSVTQQTGYQAYQYQVYAPGAYSLNLIMDQLQLAPGAELYLYDPSLSMQIGPITQKQNLQAGEFWSDLLQGERLIIELHEPLNALRPSQVHLSNVIHGYRNVFPSQNKVGESDNCEVNMACYPGFQFEGDGVVILLTQGGSAICSGSILNDSRQSFRSFLLSANHCGNLTNSLVRFKYQSPDCTPTTAPAETVTMNGTTFRSEYAPSDFSLYELKQQIPAEASATYLGWNRNDANTSNAFGIHHPSGDVKKISFTNANTQFSGYSGQGGGGTSHLWAFWDNAGVTEGGSSGSALFDGNRRIIGQLHGGPSNCGSTGNNRSDYYGRFFTSWTGGGTSDTRLSDWLDPTAIGNMTTNGVKPAVDGPATITGSGSISVNVGTSSIVSWSIAGTIGAVASTSGTGNIANVVALTNANSLTIIFSIDAGQSYPLQFSRVFNTISCSLSVASSSGPLTCANPSLTLTATATGGSNFAYTFSGPGLAGTPSSLSTATVSQAGTFSVLVQSVAGCMASTTIAVSGSGTPVGALTISTAGTICGMTSIPLTASASGAESYTLLPSGTSNSSGVFVVTTAGTYTVVARNNASGCQSQTTVTINQFSNAVVGTITASGPASCNSPARLTAPATGQSFVFTGPGGYVFSNVYRSGGSYTAFAEGIKLGGTYTLTVSSGPGCSTATSNVVVQGPSSCP